MGVKSAIVGQDEYWRPAPGFEGAYEVSDWGRIKTVRRVVMRRNGRRHTIPERVLRQGYTVTGYPMVGLTVAKRLRSKSVHRLVALAFLGPPTGGGDVNHIDGDKTNNHASNLEWVTKSENMKHAFRLGLRNKNNVPRGESHPNVCMSAGDVVAIRSAYADGERVTAIARRYGVGHNCVGKIVHRKSWRHV